MVLIPAGEFQMGKDDEGDHAPLHSVRLSAFYLDAREVTNAEYLAFCQATDHRLPMFWTLDKFQSGPSFPNHPVVGVGSADAEAYADWAGKRLPTEAEWEYAARGGLQGQDFPGGAELDSTLANYSSQHALPVGSYPPNGYGLYDMAGNVREWVSDFYDPDYYRKSPVENPRGPDKAAYRVVRGGGWFSGKYCQKIFLRVALPVQWVDFNIGFRCARDIAVRTEESGTPEGSESRPRG